MMAWVVAVLAGVVALLAFWLWKLWAYVAALQMYAQNANRRAAQAEEAADAWKASAEEYMGQREITVPIAPRRGGIMPPILRPPRTEATDDGR